MRIVLQRAQTARVSVNGEVVGELPRPGLLALVGVTPSDTAAQAAKLARRIWDLRILPDEASASDINAPILVVSQFTLYADAKKGRRPSWHRASPREYAEPLVDELVSQLRLLGAEVQTGSFGADMNVELVNNGPVTLILDADPPTI
ncbi:MAG: D-aminoacyl-tRNA deacylase [Propionibacteriaceae bacterium]